MKRADVLRAIRAAGLEDDQRRFLRLYTENRVSYKAASDAFQEGRKAAARAAKAAEKPPSPDGPLTR